MVPEPDRTVHDDRTQVKASGRGRENSGDLARVFKGLVNGRGHEAFHSFAGSTTQCTARVLTRYNTGRLNRTVARRSGDSWMRGRIG